MTSKKVREFLRAHVLGLMAIFIALSGTAIAGQGSSGDGPSASASVVTNAKFKKLKKRVSALEQKAAPVIPTTLPPSGPAGGSLTGTYPNPTIGADKVGSAEIADGSVGSAEVADTSLGGVDLKNTYTAVSAGQAVAANADASQTASCGADRLLGGGYAWLNNPAEIEMHSNAPGGVGGTPNPNTWVAEGSSSAANTLFAWAVCLPV